MRPLVLLLTFYSITTSMTMIHDDKNFSLLLANYLYHKRRFCEYSRTHTINDFGKRCKSPCNKGASGEIVGGPFWANRGKKDPTYLQNRLFVDEPHWYVMRKDGGGGLAYDPFFITRGKKTITEVKDYVTLGKIQPKKKI